MQTLGDTFGQVFQAIRANKLRSFLTMFGIAWGVGSMLLLISVGEGFRSGQQREFAELGNDVIMMWNGTIPAVPGQHTGMRPYYLTLSDAEAIRTEAPDVRTATAVVNRSDIKQQSIYETAGGQVLGVDPGYQRVRFIPLAQGRFITDDDLRSKSRVIVLGEKSAKLLFPGHPALGEWVTLNGTRFTVIGVCNHVGHGDNDDRSQQVYIPLSVMLDRFALNWGNNPQNTVSSIQYQPFSAAGHVSAVHEVHAIIARRHGFDPEASDAFTEWDSVQSQEMVSKIFDAMDIFLGGVGLVTLALGAVGIVNIMLVSVTERTSEIGLRKALGATRRSILVQFFLEGLTLTGVSGVIGIVGSALFMWILQQAFGQNVEGFDPPRLQAWSATLALVSLSLCGIVAGLYPAAQAAALEPVEALRRE
ncbi:MAG TPA: ABC transporter permease [Acidobacteriaceae bacterium]|jgi:putative ABC transport system permease protein|nr:ABC transporter permease [Acidobacteriaceae bacterium]